MPNDFDIAAKQYDTVFTFSNIGKAQRNRVFKFLNPIISQNKKLSILELNCGTGEDAIQLANLGHHIIATDVSEGMINVAKNKAYPNNLQFQVQDINTISNQSFNKTFDLIFSNFGGLNCLSKTQLDRFLKTSTSLLKPNGKLIMVLMPKQCLWERIYFSMKGHFKKAKRRNTTENILVNIDGIDVKTWYYNPKDIVSLTKSKYKTGIIKPIGIAIPPSYFETSFLAKNPLLNILVGLEKIMTGSFLAKYADHFLIELTKR